MFFAFYLYLCSERYWEKYVGLFGLLLLWVFVANPSFQSRIFIFPMSFHILTIF